MLMRLRFLAALCAVVCAAAQQGPPPDGPQPPVIRPAGPGKAPSDAIVLFDGSDLSAWTTRDGTLHGWTVAAGSITSTAKHADSQANATWDLITKQTFGDAQIHLEFSVPDMPAAKGQAKGNSGVYLQNRYEIQVLDSWENPTYANGSNGALYGRFAPLVNASLRPGEWQTYDIVFRAPQCAADGTVKNPGSLTLLHNGVLVQDHVDVVPRRGCQDTKGPLMLQDHYHPDAEVTAIRFRNIWIRPLAEKPQ
jgi:hypothetical protein